MADEGTILIVDDDENDFLLLQHAFEEANISNRVKMLSGGAEAIRYLAGEGQYLDREKYPLPSLMLLDLKMTLYDGFHVLEWCRKQSGLQYFPIVVFTSSGEQRDIQKAVELGAAAYAVKPSGLNYLVTMAKELKSRWLEGEVKLRPVLREV